MSITRRTGQLIPVEEKREYAYQSEISYPGASVRSHPSHRDHSEEAKKYDEYELTIHKHTDTAMTVELRKRRRDIVEQRKGYGAVITEEIYQTTIDFATLCNRIFAAGCDVYFEEERYPEEIREALRHAYRKSE